MIHKKKRQKIERYADVQYLESKLEEHTPESGEYLYDYKLEALQKQLEQQKNGQDVKQEDRIEIKKVLSDFKDLPISSITQVGLCKRGFTKMTEIQRCSIIHALVGRDILAASRTGSGKTLSYLIPVIEKLYRHKYTALDGPGAVILVPNRELAIQIFEVLQSISEKHELSLGLVIGGKNVKHEKDNIHKMNILVCTPGRLLQHIEETPIFNLDNVLTLVLDEADMMLEMGFITSINAIVDSINNQQKQTLLFSATLGKTVHQLSKVTLNNPEYILLHQKSSLKGETGSKLKNMYEIPAQLMQYSMQIELKDKLDVLFSFLKSHLKSKTIVFLNSCKQVRFIYEVCKRLRLGQPMFELQGRQKQTKRMAIFFTFAEKKDAVLFTTNIAARGLDFPLVNWIVQFDCPENIEEYVHRMGRTARQNKIGKSLLLLSGTESRFHDKLVQKGVNVHKIQSNPKKQLSIKNSLMSYVAEDPDLKHLAQKAFICYVKSVYLSGDKEVFDVAKMDGNGLAESYGLAQAPLITINSNQQNNSDQQGQEEREQQEEEQQLEPKKSKLNKLKEKIKAKKQSKEQKNQQINSDDDEEFLKPKKQDQTEFEQLKNEDAQFILSRNQMKKIKLDGHYQGRNKIFYDKDGKAYGIEEKKQRIFEENKKKVQDMNLADQYGMKVTENIEKDTQIMKDRIKQKRIKKKEQIKRMNQQKEQSKVELEDNEMEQESEIDQ